MTRPRLLDLFAGAGGAAMGYHRAGFDVVGVDIRPQPRYPFEFHQADALDVLDALAGACGPTPNSNSKLDLTFAGTYFDAIHASPVCKLYTVASLSHRRRGAEYPNQIPGTRTVLQATGRPWVMENVPGAPLRPDIKLCGCMFALPGLRRERWFETGGWAPFDLYPGHNHDRPPVTVAGHGQPSWTRAHGHAPAGVREWRLAMGIGWMTRDELAQAIPPAYTQYIGEQLLDHLRQRNAA
jgi:DNA (cytosine-5)-methyltransferase 1